jgi:transcriptional regulator with XRE-family HTH domain
VGRASSPTVRRRELAARLRELRVAAGLTIDEVASRLMVSATKISRLETAARPASLRDVKDLSDIYQVADEERDRLMTLARDSRRRSWWQQYELPDTLATYVGLEDAAVSIHQYLTSVVPPLLQTEEYAHAVTSGTTLDISAEQVEQRVRARLTRQTLLTSDRPPELWAIVDELALHRVVGGPAVMLGQLEALLERDQLANVTLQVIPLEAGAHPGMDSAFTVLHLEESAVSDVVYVEGLVGRFYLQSPGDLLRYRRAFDQLRAIAMSPRDSRQRVAAIASGLAP